MGQQAEAERVLDPSFCSMSLVPASCRTRDGFVAVPIMAVTMRHGRRRERDARSPMMSLAPAAPTDSVNPSLRIDFRASLKTGT